MRLLDEDRNVCPGAARRRSGTVLALQAAEDAGDVAVALLKGLVPLPPERRGEHDVAVGLERGAGPL